MIQNKIVIIVLFFVEYSGNSTMPNKSNTSIVVAEFLVVPVAI